MVFLCVFGRSNSRWRTSHWKIMVMICHDAKKTPGYHCFGSWLVTWFLHVSLLTVGSTGSTFCSGRLQFFEAWVSERVRPATA